MTREKTTRIANGFFNDMNPTLWNGEGDKPESFDERPWQCKIVDGILSEQKKEDRGVIISTAELEKYFGKEVTPAKMKEQIMSLLDDWKEKQPPELAKAPKKQELDK